MGNNKQILLTNPNSYKDCSFINNFSQKCSKHAKSTKQGRAELGQAQISYTLLALQAIDFRQPKRGCVSITLRMQRAHHLLGGKTVSCWPAERPYASEIRRRRPRGSSVTILCVVKQLVSSLIIGSRVAFNSNLLL